MGTIECMIKYTDYRYTGCIIIGSRLDQQTARVFLLYL